MWFDATGTNLEHMPVLIDNKLWDVTDAKSNLKCESGESSNLCIAEHGLGWRMVRGSIIRFLEGALSALLG